jgi:mannitol/fructose-specific phosphotransferase system IIA component (Ntr-type)
MSLLDLLSPDFIVMHPKVSSKKELFEQLLEALKPQCTSEAQFDAASEAVWARENVMSTAVGFGFALPHGKTHEVSQHMGVFGVLAEPLDYDGDKKEQVQLVFLLVGPKQESANHIKLLSQVSKLMNKEVLRQEILRASTAQEVYGLLKEQLAPSS